MQAERDAAVARCAELQAMLDDLHRLVVMRGERADQLLAEIAVLKAHGGNDRLAEQPQIYVGPHVRQQQVDVNTDDDCPF
jgi:hypothetical protein